LEVALVEQGAAAMAVVVETSVHPVLLTQDLAAVVEAQLLLPQKAEVLVGQV
jgi:hypothetical protein